MVAVADDAQSERVAVLQLGGFGMGPLFAATHPERTAALVAVDTTARFRWAEDYPQGVTDEEFDSMLATGPEAPFSVETLAPSLVGDAAFRSWYERALRLGAPPDIRRRRFLAASDLDVRAVLGSVQCPTLVVSHRQTRLTARGRAVAQRRYLADHIQNARFIEVESRAQLPFFDSGPSLDIIEEFLTGQRTAPEPDRVLATVLFTDLVASTPQAAEMGDRRWRNLLATHDALVRSQLDRFRGREIKSTGDGVLATFDGPGRAIRCACAIRDTLSALGLEMRAGLHTGEIELHRDDIAGIAVHVGQRVASHAAAGEVLVSRTVADLIAGSDIELLDRGEHELKGVSGTWRLFSVHD
jgi:class 3 adenylate cyclase